MFNKLEEQKRDYESQIRILKNEQQMRIDEAIKNCRNANRELYTENERLKEQVKILERAFENMGFDVKDMKDILNKLVDGVVAKNEIKVINPIIK